jgi:transposase
MFSLNDSLRYFLCSQATDMRKGIDSLCGEVRGSMGRDPMCGEVFVFYNRGRTLLKLLHWERGGYVIYHKRLERWRFHFPALDPRSGSYQLFWHDLVLIVEGISITSMSCKKRYVFPSKTA